MADPISGVGGRSTQALRLAEADSKKNAEADSVQSGESGGTPQQDRVELSDRVAELRKAIADGQYPLDAKKIAESFASIEGLL